MKVGIYARYSRDEKGNNRGISEQIWNCENYILHRNLSVEKRVIFIDDEITKLNRSGLQALEQSIESKHVDIIADDLGRLLKNAHQMINLLGKFRFFQINIISISEEIFTLHDHSA